MLLDTKFCLNELQKYYCLKTKLIALDWQWVTLISWGQKNRDIHSSPVMYKVEGKTQKLLEKLNVLKIGHCLKFVCKVFSDHLCWHILIKKIIPLNFIHVWLCADLVFAILIAIHWFRFCFGLCGVKTNNTYSQVGYHQKLTFFLTLDFLQLFL